MPNTSGYLHERENGISVTIHAQPRAKKTEVVGLHGESLKLRIAAPPVEGAANDEIVRFFSKLLGVPQSRVTLARGSLSRHKVVEINGITAAQFLDVLRKHNANIQV